MADCQIYEYLRKNVEPVFAAEDMGIHPLTKRAFNLAMGEWIVSDAHGFWLDPESRDGHSDPFEFITTIAERISTLSWAHDGSTFGSPIEAQLLAALLWVPVDWCGFPKFDGIGAFDRCEPSSNDECWITSQADIEGHRVDLLLWICSGSRRAGIAIECDGHEFHEKTKEQAARDKKRDRDLLNAGYPVMRFTGSEIYKDPVACAEQVGGPIREALDRVSMNTARAK